MSGVSRLYSIKMKGEKHTYELRGYDGISLSSLCNTISDLTGFKPEYIEKFVREIRIGRQKEVRPAAIGQSFSDPPAFVIKRVA